MRKLARIALLSIGALVLLAILALSGFRVAAMLRETQDPVAAAGQNALFVEANGLRIHYRVWGPEDGPPLVLVHGTLSWAGTWADVAEPLAAQGYRVIAPDMPPFGFSDKAPDGDYSRPASARRLRGFLDALNLEHLVLAVHSYGGGPALEAAFAQPERFDGLILLDVALGLQREKPNAPPAGPLMGIGPIRNAITATTFSNPMMIGQGLRNFVYDDSLIDSARIALYARPLAVRGSTDAIGHWLVNGLFGEPSGALSDDLANYKAFAKPVLVIWGEEDKTTPLDQGRFIAQAFPNARLEILPEVDHIPQLENPKLVVQMIDRFMKALPARETAKTAPTPKPVPDAPKPVPAAATAPSIEMPDFLRGTLD